MRALVEPNALACSTHLVRERISRIRLATSSFIAITRRTLGGVGDKGAPSETSWLPQYKAAEAAAFALAHLLSLRTLLTLDSQGGIFDIMTKDDENKKPLPNCFFEVVIGGDKAQRVEFKLYDDVCPKTAANFRALCTGKKADGEALPKNFGYEGTIFHRIIPGFMVQGGDFERKDGTGGVSIYGTKFDDENFEKKHDKAGLLSSANSGPNTNGSQFFVTTASKCEWLDGKHVVFGEVVEGMDVIKAMEKVGHRDGKVSKKVVVEKCGVVA